SPAPLEQALVETGARARPLFGPSEERIRAELGESPWDLPDLSLYYHVTVEADHEAVAARLNEEESVAGAYVKAPLRLDPGPPTPPRPRCRRTSAAARVISTLPRAASAPARRGGNRAVTAPGCRWWWSAGRGGSRTRTWPATWAGSSAGSRSTLSASATTAR